MILRGELSRTDDRYELILGEVYLGPVPDPPLPDDVLLVVEAADSSLCKDRNQQARLYAQAGIAEYGIANIPQRCLEIRRDTEGDRHKTRFTVRVGDEARPLAFPDVAMPVAKLFPEA